MSNFDFSLKMKARTKAFAVQIVIAIVWDSWMEGSPPSPWPSPPRKGNGVGAL